jgi:hypothetical protein
MPRDYEDCIQRIDRTPPSRRNAPIKTGDRSDVESEGRACSTSPWTPPKTKALTLKDSQLDKNEMSKTEIKLIQEEAKNKKRRKPIQKERREPQQREEYSCSNPQCEATMLFYPSQVTDPETLKCKKCRRLIPR